MANICFVLRAEKTERRCTSNGMIAGLKQLGHTVDKIVFRKKDLWPGDRKITERFKRNIPEDAIVIMPKGAHLRPEAIQALKLARPDWRLVFWSADSIACGPRDGRQDGMLQRVLAFDDVIFTGYEACKFMRENGYEGRLAQVFQGFRPEVWHPTPASPVRNTAPKVSFLGSFYQGDGGRRRILDSIRHIGFKLNIGTHVYLEHAAAMYRTSRINLNIACGEIISNRMIRILAAGGFCLTPVLKDLQEGYPEGTVATYEYQDLKDLHEKVRHYMKYPDEAAEIAARGLELARTRPWLVQMGKVMKFLDGESICDGAATEYCS